MPVYIYNYMDKIIVREHINVDGFIITEEQADELQREMDISQKAATYMMKKWQALQKSSSKEEFARIFLAGMKDLLKLSNAASDSRFITANIQRILSTWRLALTTDKAKELGLSLKDLKTVQESLGYQHASIGRSDDKSPKDV